MADPAAPLAPGSDLGGHALRQLARVYTRGDEEGIRASLDDLDGRLEELRRLERVAASGEKVRARAGTATGGVSDWLYPLISEVYPLPK